jgi:hypothetical protein
MSDDAAGGTSLRAKSPTIMHSILNSHLDPRSSPITAITRSAAPQVHASSFDMLEHTQTKIPPTSITPASTIERSPKETSPGSFIQSRVVQNAAYGPTAHLLHNVGASFATLVGALICRLGIRTRVPTGMTRNKRRASLKLRYGGWAYLVLETISSL